MRKRKAERRCVARGYESRRETSRLLRESGARLLLAEASIPVLVPWILPILLSQALRLAFYPQMTASATAELLVRMGGALLGGLVLLFLTLPLTTGLLGLAAQVEAGEEVALSALFRPFGSWRAYGEALLLSARFFWRLGIAVLAVRVSFALVRPWAALAPLYALIGCGVILSVLFLSALLLLSGFGAAYAALGRPSGHRARFCHRVREGLRFFVGYMPTVLLSVLSVGVLLPVDTLPRMLLGYFRYCRRWNELTIRSEENRDE